MRWQSVVLAALLVVTVPATAQESGAMLEDDAGDEMMQVAGSPMQPPGGRQAFLDLQQLDWDETPEGFQFVLTLGQVGPAPGSNLLDMARYFIGFTFEDVTYGIEMDRFVDVDGAVQYDAYVGPSYDEEDYRYMDYMEDVPLEVDAEANTITGTFSRQALLDANGAPAALGHTISDFFVESQGAMIIVIGGTPTSFVTTDRMPDTGTAGVHEVAFGMAQSGDARLASMAPFRLSNGGATNIVYEVQAQTFGDKQSFKLAVESVPDGWTVSLPFDRLVLEEGEPRSFPILLTTPSGHNHGGAKKFLLTMTGERNGGDVGRVELGLRYTSIPQPAGHHPTLYLHSSRPYGEAAVPETETLAPGLFFGLPQGYINAAPPKEDPGDTQEPLPTYSGLIPGFNWFEWYMPMLPGLGMGLDFDTKSTGTLTLPISYEYVAQDVTVRASLYYENYRNGFTAARSLPTAAISFGPQAQETLELTMEIDKQADFIPYDPDARVYLAIEMEGMFAGPSVGPGSVPVIQPGGKLDLPLIEYHDQLDGFYQAVESLVFDKDYLERPVNPGKTVVFETTLRNTGTEREPIHLNLTGINSDWARVVGPTSFDLDRGAQRTLAVAVTIPEGTPDGALADLVLQAVSEREAFRRALIDFIAIVDEEGDHPDESGRIADLDKRSGDKQGPGFEIAATGLALLALALLVRRRR